MSVRLLRGALRGGSRADSRLSSRATTYFASSVVATLISFVTLPLATRILGPANYGVFALGATVAGFGATLATLGTSFYVANQFAGAELAQRQRLVSALVVRTALFAAGWATLTLLGTLLLRGHVELLDEVPLRGFALVLAGAILATPWTIAVDVLTVEGKASWFSLTLIVQALTTAFALLVSLYVFDLGGLSLFVGSFAGSCSVLFTTVVVLRPYLSLRQGLRRERLRQRAFLPMQGLEALQPVVERVLLARYTGFTQLGNYAHSLAYRNMIGQAMSAVNRAVWPITLAEAKENRGFDVTGRTWAAAHLAIGMAALPFVLFGDRLISILTNDKLTPAWVFLAPWFVLVLLQSSGKSAMGVVYASGDSRTVARLGLAANGVALASLIVFVPWLGVAGAALALLSHAVVFRVALQVLARRHQPVPFQDWGAVFACGLITLLFLVRRYAVESSEGLLLVLFCAEATCLLVGWNVIRRTVAPFLLRARAHGEARS